MDGRVMDSFLQARRSPPPPALSERRHRGLACRLVAVDRRAVFVVAKKARRTQR